MLSDPVGVPCTFWRWTQGAPPWRRPWALLFNRFTVMSIRGCEHRCSIGRPDLCRECYLGWLNLAVMPKKIRNHLCWLFVCLKKT